MKTTFSILGLGLSLLLAAPASASSIFDFQFDNQGLNSGTLNSDGPLSGSIVGTGTFTSPIDLTAGTYQLSALAGFTFDFTFSNGASFTQANISTADPTLAGIGVKITGSGSNERLFFTESPGSSAQGTLGGALDLVNGSNALTFEPTIVGGNFAYQELSGTTVNYSGRYLGLAAASTPPVTSVTPEPASFALLLTGISGLGLTKRRFRR